MRNGSRESIKAWIIPGLTELRHLRGNTAYLVKVDDSAPTFTWNLKGRPVAPRYTWTTTGLNFLGFPTPSVDPPSFATFLSRAPHLRQNAQIFEYTGGVLGPANPAQVFGLRTTEVTRGEAYWIRSGDVFNHYFGPFDVVMRESDGVDFGETGGQVQFRLRNQTADEIVVNLALVASEAAPDGQDAVAGEVPVLVRGALDTTNLTHAFDVLATVPQSWTLAPKGQLGSEAEVVIGVNRSEMGGDPGDPFAGILRFTDSAGLSQVDIPVTAEAASTAGLWMGGATVTSVAHYLKTFAKADTEAEFEALLARLGLENGVDGFTYEWVEETGRVLVYGGPEGLGGSYLLDGPIKTNPGTVAAPFPLRLIVHHDGTTARLMQRAYVGLGLASDVVVATQQDFLSPDALQAARRVSAVHLPATAGNVPWNFSGDLARGETLTVNVDLSYDDPASNPFLHGYHPDHDNLQADFTSAEDRGRESYTVRRTLRLTVKTPADDFESLTSGGRVLHGDYAETVAFLGEGDDSLTFDALGSFTLRRILEVSHLTTE